MIVDLKQEYRSRGGAPIIDRVDVAIFHKVYFMQCMSCTFCYDVCCHFGVDVDVENMGRILEHAEKLEAFTNTSRDEWFENWRAEDQDFPGGQYTRTRRDTIGCIFLNKTGRGCGLHTFCLTEGLDYHELKPLVSTLFPLTFDNGLLGPSNELKDDSVICAGQGTTLYRGVRDELNYYFGPGLVAELDALEQREGLGSRAESRGPEESSAPPR